MNCGNCRSSIATTRYAYGRPIRRITALCAPCAASLTALGMDLRASRAEAAPVDNRPAWVRNLRAKDFTGSIA